MKIEQLQLIVSNLLGTLDVIAAESVTARVGDADVKVDKEGNVTVQPQRHEPPRPRLDKPPGTERRGV